MTRNDTFFKIIFAIEIALLPLVMSAYILMPEWTIGMFVAGVLVAKIWMELFKSKEMRSHIIINAVASVLTTVSLVIFFTIYDYISIVLCVFVVIFSILMNVFKVLYHSKRFPEMIDAVDSCYMLFECLTLIALTFVVFYDLVTTIALFALLMTAVVSVAYKVYYMFRYEGMFGKIKNLFRGK